ncbi:MAG: 1-acyl-sn-glycerol-3-phosphate acyltransferase, partial [Spirochaetota bacterium]|nr:1-acyl-sn-glycerol-3-phosphate acyltransferase [Spirochaetota bacterium]
MLITGFKLIIIIIITLFWSTLAVITGPLNFILPAYHVISTSWAKWLICVSGVKINIVGLENISLDKNYVFVSNHSSLFDIPVLLSSIKNEIKMIAKKELAYIPIWGWSLVAGGYILIDRKNPKNAFKAMKKAEKKLKKGTSILVFPEGTRSDNGSVQEFKKGAFMLAIQTHLDMIPISIINSHKVMPKKSFKLSPVTVHLIIDKPISMGEIKSLGKDDFINKVRELIIKNCQENRL